MGNLLDDILKRNNSNDSIKAARIAIRYEEALKNIRDIASRIIQEKNDNIFIKSIENMAHSALEDGADFGKPTTIPQIFP